MTSAGGLCIAYTWKWIEIKKHLEIFCVSTISSTLTNLLFVLNSFGKIAIHFHCLEFLSIYSVKSLWIFNGILLTLELLYPWGLLVMQKCIEEGWCSWGEVKCRSKKSARGQIYLSWMIIEASRTDLQCKLNAPRKSCYTSTKLWFRYLSWCFLNIRQLVIR